MESPFPSHIVLEIGNENELYRTSKSYIILNEI